MVHLRPVFLLTLAFALPLAAQVSFTAAPGKIAIEIDGKPFSDFYISGTAFNAQVAKPYLWPLRAASGTYVTRAWPMQEVDEEAGEKKPGRNGAPPAFDHPHQRGLWFAHDTVNGLDFWNNEATYKTPNRGRISLKNLGEIKSGKTQGSIAATFEWADMEGKNPLLTESRVMTFYSDPKLRYFDVDLTLTAIANVTFGDGKDGAFGIRLRPVLQEDKGHSKITNAEGLAGEKQLWGKPSNWCDYSGEIAGEKVGVAIFDHPANPRHPVRWHARAYGLFAANPWGAAVFTNDKSQNGAISLAPGQSLRYRYRVIIHPGDVKDADIAGLWAKYAAGN
jgi:hypothetical protein